MVEATIVAPVLILVLIGATYFRELYIARAAARLTARSCAWEHAMNGCRGDRPASCDSSLSDTDASGLPRIAATAHMQTGGGVDPFSEIPVLGAAFQALFGTSTRATATAQVPFPLDDRRVGVARGEAVVLCNSVPTNVLDVALDWLCGRLLEC